MGIGYYNKNSNEYIPWIDFLWTGHLFLNPWTSVWTQKIEMERYYTVILWNLMEYTVILWRDLVILYTHG